MNCLFLPTPEFGKAILRFQLKCGWPGQLSCGHSGEERDEPCVVVSDLFKGNMRGRQ